MDERSSNMAHIAKYDFLRKLVDLSNIKNMQ